MKYLVIVMALSLTGCGFKGEVDPAYVDKTVYCTDTRDGEKFSFAAASVRDVSMVIGAGTCATVTTNKGTDMRICNAQEVYMKCETR